MGIVKEIPVTRRDVIIAVWESLDCEAVGAAELGRIRQAVTERYGDGAVESPAAIARILADEGAVLRHPEVLESDAKWREAQFARPARKIGSDYSTLDAAAESIFSLEELRKRFAEAGDSKGLPELIDEAIKIRQDRLMVSRSPILPEPERAEAAEVASWLELWLRTPELFSEWLALRLAAPEFQRRFGAPPPKS